MKHKPYIKVNLLAGSSYFKFLKELGHPRKSLVNIENTDDNEAFKGISSGS